jgi:hypothetical protein
MPRGALVHFDLRFRKDKIDMVGTVVHVCIPTESWSVWGLSCDMEFVKQKIILDRNEFYHVTKLCKACCDRYSYAGATIQGAGPYCPLAVMWAVRTHGLAGMSAEELVPSPFWWPSRSTTAMKKLRFHSTARNSGNNYTIDMNGFVVSTVLVKDRHQDMAFENSKESRDVVRLSPTKPTEIGAIVGLKF